MCMGSPNNHISSVYTVNMARFQKHCIQNIQATYLQSALYEVQQFQYVINKYNAAYLILVSCHFVKVSSTYFSGGATSATARAIPRYGATVE